MKRFSNISQTTLLDMLAQHTSLYTQLLSDNIKTNEFYKCRRMIEQLTSEIESRKVSTTSVNPAKRTAVPSREE